VLVTTFEPKTNNNNLYASENIFKNEISDIILIKISGDYLRLFLIFLTVSII